MTDTITPTLDPLDELLVARHGHLVSEVLDLRTELMRIEQLLKSRKVQFESYFPSARSAPDEAIAASTDPAQGAQPAGGVSGVIPPATPALSKKPASKPVAKAATSKARKAGEKRSLQCAQCGRVFASFGGLRIHQGRSGHAGQTTPSAPPAPAEVPADVPTGADSLERQPAAPVSVIDDDTMALRCDDCSFAAPVGPLQPLRAHVLDVHKRVLSNTERKPRLVVE
jgi:hypothetical protein